MNERIIHLEMLLAHLEKTVQELDQVIQQQGSRIDFLERDLKKTSLELGILRESAYVARTPEEEKPPHY
jgi:SlyX protein